MSGENRRNHSSAESAVDGLRDSEHHLPDLLTEMIVRWLPDGTRTQVNDSYCRQFNLTRQEAEGTNFFSLVPDEDRQGIRDMVASLTPDEPTYTEEHRAYTSGDQTAWHEWTTRGLFDGQGKLFELVSVGRDITARHEAEEALRTSEEKFAKAFRSTPDAFIISRLSDGQLVEVNDGFVALSGRSRDEAVGKSTVALGMWADPAQRDAMVAQLRSSGQLRNFEVEMNHPSGKKLYALLSAEVMELGGEPHIVTIGRDITEHKAAQAEIERLKNQLELENEYLRQEVRGLEKFGEIIGESSAVRKVMDQAALVAATEAPVLIVGESGTGKELVARAIHDRSERAAHTLVKVNCASIPRELFESEFFGHAKGAFTGAVKDRIGRFELANGGTLFLDEIGEIPFELQGKLLRVLQEGEFERIGEDRTRKVDVRIIAATNRDLEEEIKRQRFREDLYFRLSVFPIRVPPLRERGDDVILLAQSFLKADCRRLGIPVLNFRKKHVLQMRQYDWPGNVRELQNVIQRAAITSQHGRLDLDLPHPVELRNGQDPAPATESEQTEDQILTASEWKAVEARNITMALKRTNWKIWGAGGAAELLDMHPSTLTSRIRKLGLTRNSKT